MAVTEWQTCAHRHKVVTPRFLGRRAPAVLLLACLSTADAFAAFRALPLAPHPLSGEAGFRGPPKFSRGRPFSGYGVVLSTGDDVLAGSNGPAQRSLPEIVSERASSVLGKILSHRNEKSGRRLGVVVKSLWWLLALPLGIAAYLAMIHVLAVTYKACPQCVDPLNILLFSIQIPWLGTLPVCLWNLSHLIMYYNFVRVIPFKRRGANHAFAIFIGVLWYFMEPALFTMFASKEIVSAAHACSTSGLITTVYESTWRPRADDMVFNTGGQVLYEVVRYVRGRKRAEQRKSNDEEAKNIVVA